MIVPWLVAQAAFLVAEPAMWRPHVSQIVAPLALLSVLRPAPWRVLALLGVVLLPWWVSNAQPMLWPDDYSRAEAQVVARLRRLPDDCVGDQRRPRVRVACRTPCARTSSSTCR